MLRKVFSKRGLSTLIAGIAIVGFLTGCGSQRDTQRMPENQPGTEQQDPQQQDPQQQDPGQQQDPQQQDPGQQQDPQM